MCIELSQTTSVRSPLSLSDLLEKPRQISVEALPCEPLVSPPLCNLRDCACSAWISRLHRRHLCTLAQSLQLAPLSGLQLCCHAPCLPSSSNECTASALVICHEPATFQSPSVPLLPANEISCSLLWIACRSPQALMDGAALREVLYKKTCACRSKTMWTSSVSSHKGLMRDPFCSFLLKRVVSLVSSSTVHSSPCAC